VLKQLRLRRRRAGTVTTYDQARQGPAFESSCMKLQYTALLDTWLTQHGKTLGCLVLVRLPDMDCSGSSAALEFPAAQRRALRLAAGPNKKCVCGVNAA
jgi:hypothetical protein